MLTHVDQNQRPIMVDITAKTNTQRKAIARSRVFLPEIFKDYFIENELILKKGPVFNTAIVAGVQAVKKTYELIPFCHQIPIEGCEIQIVHHKDLEIEIYCTVKTTFKTGVEMEALVGANIAALTIYDMCKAFSSDITIQTTELVFKSGGKSLTNKLPFYGLVLAGGQSSRMKSDKALLEYYNKPQAQILYEHMTNICNNVFISQKANQRNNSKLSHLNIIEDRADLEGPMAGIISAMEKYPFANWIILACDLPYVTQGHLIQLKNEFDPSKLATSYLNQKKSFAEPLCSIYSPDALNLFKESYRNGVRCPVKVLLDQDVKGIKIESFDFLQNINTPEEFEGVKNEIN